MDIEPVDLRDELGERIQLGLELAPVIIRGPVVDELLYLRQLRALGAIADGLIGGPAGHRHTAAELLERLLRDVDPEGANAVISRHVGLLWCEPVAGVIRPPVRAGLSWRARRVLLRRRSRIVLVAYRLKPLIWPSVSLGGRASSCRAVWAADRAAPPSPNPARRAPPSPLPGPRPPKRPGPGAPPSGIPDFPKANPKGHFPVGVFVPFKRNAYRPSSWKVSGALVPASGLTVIAMTVVPGWPRKR